MFKAVSLAVAALWGVFALVQLNDPDPAAWVFVYGFTAAWTAVQAFRPLPWVQAALWAALCTAWAAWIFGTWDGSSNPMAGPGEGLLAEEVVRESLGLLLVAVWMGGLAFRQWRIAGAAAEAPRE